MPEAINVQCVHGNAHVEHIKSCVIPNLRAAASIPVNLLLLNYESLEPFPPIEEQGLTVASIAPPRLHAGFGENHNHIFSVSHPVGSFVLMNPDCIPLPQSIDYLLARKAADVAIVEGRQWPFEHPKPHDPATLETAWASFAFCLLDSGFYAACGGMDPLYFLYCEDVDLSWRAWLSGYRVLYEPAAQIMHFTDGPFRRPDWVSPEVYYSARNFLLISRKFFGARGERKAFSLLRSSLDASLYARVEADYLANIQPHVPDGWADKKHPHVRIYGLNAFAPSPGRA